MIEVRGLVKTFGFRPVLRGVDLNVARGECVVLLGANGAGKSTLMRILSALSKPSAGTVTIGGWSLPREAAAIRAHLGFVGHLPLLYGDLSAEENLAFFAHLYGVPQVNIAGALERVGLGKRARDRVGTFSRGMQQRLGIARALLHAPDVLLLDEPYTGLDVDGCALLDSLIVDLAAQGRTLFMTSHDLSRSLALGNRILILNRGVIAFDEPARKLDVRSLGERYTEITAQIAHSEPAS